MSVLNHLSPNMSQSGQLAKIELEVEGREIDRLYERINGEHSAGGMEATLQMKKEGKRNECTAPCVMVTVYAGRLNQPVSLVVNPLVSQTIEGDCKSGYLAVVFPPSNRDKNTLYFAYPVYTTETSQDLARVFRHLQINVGWQGNAAQIAGFANHLRCGLFAICYLSSRVYKMYSDGNCGGTGSRGEVETSQW